MSVHFSVLQARSMVNHPLFYKAWARLLLAYLFAFVVSFVLGSFCITVLGVQPEVLFEISTKRLSFAFPVLQTTATLGVDEGLVLFAWNTLGALVTISFLYAAPLFHPLHLARSPQLIRKIFCGTKRMKLLCFLPGCMDFEEESLRRVYVWLMIPWLAMILLGMESGLGVSTSAYLFGSSSLGFLSLIPHGIIEIPAFAFAGAHAFGAHLLIKKEGWPKYVDGIFHHLETYTKRVPLLRAILIVTCCLLIAGLVEAHITQRIVDTLQTS